MGTTKSVSVFTEEELQDYRDLTVFTKNEIQHVYERFQVFGTKKNPATKESKIPREDLYKLKELRVNPFKDRIVTVFSSSRDGYMTFEDFLDMMSVFSEKSPIQIKAEYLFRIYDFDDDGYLGWEDMRTIINRMTGDEKLEESDIDQLIENIYSEADVDDDGRLSFPEFDNIVDNCPSLVGRFRFRL
ncbi:calcium and integrin-binding protein 1-like [Saccostrea echinata]|uniref:calcium and integrin-binding protein 1-like n=1 Tax=Saccostrea echinata TaxID=191078 RepID=UPI002A8003F0|nr:calcium and integrin-binding protein 1-like [Saccostrea echinata]